MGEYKPPFTITNKILSYVSSISEKIGRIAANSSLEAKPHLRRNSRIKSIHMTSGTWNNFTESLQSILWKNPGNSARVRKVFSMAIDVSLWHRLLDLYRSSWLIYLPGWKKHRMMCTHWSWAVYFTMNLYVSILFLMTIPDKPNSRNQRYVRRWQELSWMPIM